MERSRYSNGKTQLPSHLLFIHHKILFFFHTSSDPPINVWTFLMDIGSNPTPQKKKKYLNRSVLGRINSISAGESKGKIVVVFFIYRFDLESRYTLWFGSRVTTTATPSLSLSYSKRDILRKGWYGFCSNSDKRKIDLSKFCHAWSEIQFSLIGWLIIEPNVKNYNSKCCFWYFAINIFP